MSGSARSLGFDAATARAIELHRKHHNSYAYISDYMLRHHGLRLTADEWRQRCGGRRLGPPKPKADAIRFPAPSQAFTRGYRRALAAGIDLLEARDAFYECKHGELPGECNLCDPAPVTVKKTREAA